MEEGGEVGEVGEEGEEGEDGEEGEEEGAQLGKLTTIRIVQSIITMHQIQSNPWSNPTQLRQPPAPSPPSLKPTDSSCSERNTGRRKQTSTSWQQS